MNSTGSTINSTCIQPNSDISGIGVRIAIYAQNILCFIPVFLDLLDGKVTTYEMTGIRDQSIGMLITAFSILATFFLEGASNANVTGQQIDLFHTLIVLNLSWMNNTSTWIWFLLHVHQRTK
ncbi:hypothetical protein GYMLUDRAFT_181288, partial [Collybiopsis luxurians FD-317 M1]